MNRQFKTDGLILRKSNLNDADQILTVLTRDRGKISCIAKGCRRLKSRFCGRLEILYEVRLAGFEGRELAHLDEVELLDARSLLDCGLTAKSALFAVAETTHRLIGEGQQADGAYPLLLSALDALNCFPLKTEMLFYGYLIKLLTLLGFMAPWRTPRAPSTIEKWAAYLQEKDFAEIAKIRATPSEYALLWNTLNQALGDILNSPLKSETFLRQAA